MRRILLWCSGYTVGVAEQASPADQEQLLTIGRVILFASIFTGTAWSIAATGMTGGLVLWMRVLIGAAAGLTGFGLVMVFDRAAIFLQDQSPHGKGGGWFWFRLALILAIGTFTSERVLPVFLGPELAAQALRDREASDAQRDVTLQLRFRPGDLASAAGNADKDVTDLTARLGVVPPEIAAEQRNAEACRRDVEERQSRLLLGGVPRAEVRIALRVAYGRCADAQRNAQADLKRYLNEIDQRLKTASDTATAAHQQAGNATREVSDRERAAAAVEADAISTGSANVLLHTVLSNPIALFKALALYVVMLSIELAPFVIKSRAGPTALGQRLAGVRAAEVAEAQADQAEREDAAGVRTAMSASIAQAMIAAFQSGEVREHIASLAAARARSLAPLIVAEDTLREAVRRRAAFEAIAAGARGMEAFSFRLWLDAFSAAARAL